MNKRKKICVWLLVLVTLVMHYSAGASLETNLSAREKTDGNKVKDPQQIIFFYELSKKKPSREIVFMLKNAKATLDDSSHETLIAQAIKNDNAGTIKLLAGLKANLSTLSYGRTPLIEASRDRAVEVVMALVEAGVPLDPPPNYCVTYGDVLSMWTSHIADNERKNFESMQYLAVLQKILQAPQGINRYYGKEAFRKATEMRCNLAAKALLEKNLYWYGISKEDMDFLKHNSQDIKAKIVILLSPYLITAIADIITEYLYG